MIAYRIEGDLKLRLLEERHARPLFEDVATFIRGARQGFAAGQDLFNDLAVYGLLRPELNGSRRGGRAVTCREQVADPDLLGEQVADRSGWPAT
jgi:hypothetical protein